VIKTILLSLKELGVKVRRLKELFGIPKSSFYEMSKNKEPKDNFLIDKKKVYRIYKMLNLERENKKKKTFIHSSTNPSITSSPNQRNKIWAMDFIHDSLSIELMGVSLEMELQNYYKHLLKEKVSQRS